MASFTPEAEVFEITDFTNATEWESFSSRVEDVLREWNLAGSCEETPAPVCSAVQPHDIALGSQVYTLTFYDCRSDETVVTVQQALVEDGNQFPVRTHCLTRWFGVKRFIILAPGPGCADVSDLSRARQLLSSLTVAAGQVCCSVPLFVQIHKADRRVFEGTWHGGDGLRTNFSVVQLRKIPTKYNHLSGVLEIFKSELGIVAPPPIPVAVRFTYMLRSWPAPSVQWSSEGMSALPLGANFDPVLSLQLSVTWQNAREDTIVDNALYSDLDPVMAPAWELRPIYQESEKTPHGRSELSKMLHSFLQLCARKESLTGLLGRHAFLEDEPSAELQGNVRSALQRITNLGMQTSSLSYFVQSAVTSSALEDSPLDDAIVAEVMRLLFPERSDFHPDENITSTPGGEDNGICKFRSAPEGSLVERLALCLLWIHEERGGIRPMAYIWREFVLHLRQCYEQDRVLPDIPRGCVPDMTYCLLQQKLHMLQCCIEHKLAREKRQREKIAVFGTAAAGLPMNDADATLEESNLAEGENSAGWADADNLSISSEGVEEDSNSPAERSTSVAENAATEQAGESAQATQEETEEDDIAEDSSTARVSTTTQESDSDDEFFEAFEEPPVKNSKASSVSEEAASVEAVNDDTVGDGATEVSSEAGETEPAVDAVRDSSDLTSQADNSLREEVAVNEPVGVLSTTDMVLLVNGCPLNIPVTQEVTPMTEDMLAEQQKMLASLGTSDEARQLRARMQSMQLLADMEAFKAANPGCVLGDFVRWYSPRDWLEDEDSVETESSNGTSAASEDDRSKLLEQQQSTQSWNEAEWEVVTEKEMLTSALSGLGMVNSRGSTHSSSDQESQTSTNQQYCQPGRLSVRMREGNSLWHQLWSSARAVPAHRQRRLFDDTSEATKVLNFLQDLTVGELALHLAPIVLHQALLTVQQRLDCTLSPIKVMVETAEKELASLFQTTMDGLPKVKQIVSLLSGIELKLVQASALREILRWGFEHCCLVKPKDGLTDDVLNKCIEEALLHPHVPVINGSHNPLGRAICGVATMQVFQLEQQSKLKEVAVAEKEDSDEKVRPAATKFPLPAAREFVFRASLPRPSPTSRSSSQRMFAVLTADEFRLASAFSSDVKFI